MTIHASRSRYEAFMKCPRLGYLQYHYLGLGINKAGKNMFLATGIHVHRGLELLAKWFKDSKKLQIEEGSLGGIIQKVKEEYFEYVFPKVEREKGTVEGFNLVDEMTDQWTGETRQLTDYEMQQLQQYTFDEQSALAEGLIRIAAIRLFPRWLQKYKIVAIENDMAFPLVKGWKDWEVIQSAKIDLVLQEIESKDLFLVSFKSARSFDRRTAKQASHDTQGLSESWAFDELLRSKKIDKRIMGVKMLYLIKGGRKETKKGSGIWEQTSPLIRGFRKLTQDEIEYAHSWFFPNTKNDSGIGALGKSWDRFDVFRGAGLEEVGGVKGWIEMLDGNHEHLNGIDSYNYTIQPECGDILGEQIIEPEAYLRHERDIESWLRQTKARETEIALKLISEEYGNEGINFMDDYFPQNRQACHYYPGQLNDCQMIDVCFGTQEQKENPFGNGFVERVPHHKAELVQIGVK